MKTRGLVILVSLSISSATQGASVDSLRKMLSELRGSTRVAASIERRTDTTERGRQKSQHGLVTVEQNGDEFHLVYPARDVLRVVSRGSGDGTETFAAIGALEAYKLVNYGVRLARDLEHGTIVRQASTVWRGRAATVVELRIDEPVAPEDKKYVKNAEFKLTLWLGVDGVPVASEERMVAKGRFLLIGFEVSERETSDLARVGDRLVVTRQEHEQTSSGAASDAHTKTISTVTIRN